MVGRWGRGGIVEELEEAGAGRHRGAHDDGFADARDVVNSAVQGGIEEVISSLLKGSSMQDTVFHFADTSSCDAQHFSLEAVLNKSVESLRHVPCRSCSQQEA